MSKIGELTSIMSQELAELVENVDAVAFTTGAGGSGPDATTAVDARRAKAFGARRIKGADRFGFLSAIPEAWRERNLGAGFDHSIAVRKHAHIASHRPDANGGIPRPSRRAR